MLDKELNKLCDDYENGKVSNMEFMFLSKKIHFDHEDSFYNEIITARRVVEIANKIFKKEKIEKIEDLNDFILSFEREETLDKLDKN